MHFTRSLLLLAAITTTPILATPIATTFADVEKRWSAGESEAQIHAAHTHRDATPSWPVAPREAGAETNAFPTANDERTLSSRKGKRRVAATEALKAKMRAFADRVLRAHGREELVSERAVEGEEEMAPVLKPRRGMRYSFTA